MSTRPIGFVAFLEQHVGLRLSLAQRVFALTLDGRELATDEERDMFRDLFAFEREALPADAGRVTFLLKGSRCGGTLLCASFGLYRALTADLSQLRKGERCFVGFTGADVRHAREALAQAAATIDRDPSIASLVVSRSTEKIELRRPHDGRVVVLQCLPATPSAPRGRWFAAVLVTEADYLGAADGAAPGEEVVRAYAGRMIRGGKLLAESTPWCEGYWSKLFASDYGAPKSALVCSAPTLTFYPTDETRALVEAERARDPIACAREFECQWVTGGAAYFDRDAIEKAIDPARPLDLPPMPGSRVGVGLDLAFRGDASACVVVMDRGDGIAAVARVELAKPARGRALVPSEVLAHFAEIARSYGASLACADSHYLDTAREVFATHGIQLVATGNSAESKVKAFAHARETIHRGGVRLPPSGPLRDELRAVTVRNLAGGGVKIESPRRAGTHGDAASALVASIWALRLGGSYDANLLGRGAIRTSGVPTWHYGQSPDRRAF